LEISYGIGGMGRIRKMDFSHKDTFAVILKLEGIETVKIII
jgi:hypothetical protein